MKQIIMLLSLALLCAGGHTQAAVPNPLSLEQALKLADDHPISKGTAEGVLLASVQPARSLYLNCHNLAYNNAVISDSSRDDALQFLVPPKVLQQLRILEHYLDVLMADLAYMHDNESMAISYIDYDRANTRMELKQYSEIYVAELESLFQADRQKYIASGASQQLSRLMLATAINSPDELPSDLDPFIAPELPDNAPEVKHTLDAISSNNHWLKDRIGNAAANEKQFYKLLIRRITQELTLRFNVLTAAQQRAIKENDFRDLKLEQSRALYEQEVKADLGDSMAMQTRAHFQQQQIDFCRAFTWAQINALQNQPFFRIPQPAEKKQEATP